MHSGGTAELLENPAVAFLPRHGGAALARGPVRRRMPTFAFPIPQWFRDIAHTILMSQEEKEAGRINLLRTYSILEHVCDLTIFFQCLSPIPTNFFGTPLQRVL